MRDALRESLSYWGLYYRMFRAKREVTPEYVPFGQDKHQYFLYYEPKHAAAGKVLLWVHGGGWNAGSPKDFDFAGQCAARHGYRFVSIGYRLAPRHKYPCQLEDVCAGYRAAVRFLSERGIDTGRLIVSGPSAGAHLASILCCGKGVREEYGVDLSHVAGFIGAGGPYAFSGKQTLAVRLLLDQLFAKGYDRALGEPCSLMGESHIPMLLIQSRHDGVIDYSCAERFREKAESLGNRCELYDVTDRRDTHSWYTAGMFLETRERCRCLDKFFSWIEALP